MNATTTNEAGLAGYAEVAQAAASSDAVRLAQYSWLNEVPGLVIGLVTMAYLVTSLLALQ
ncbi:MAG TPA: hypothetical protein VMV27_02235 [Candidatus Binataceae bacterium]|nr:hypothetical protein [Candidatus Binataceae bacterium]